MNIADEINSVIRKLTISDEAYHVVLERRFETDTADLWSALTSAERLARWFEPTSGDLSLGGRYRLGDSGTEGVILRCEPPRHLAIT